MSSPVQAARNYTHHRHLLLLLSPKADTHFTVPRRVEGWRLTESKILLLRVLLIKSCEHWNESHIFPKVVEMHIGYKLVNFMFSITTTTCAVHKQHTYTNSRHGNYIGAMWNDQKMMVVTDSRSEFAQVFGRRTMPATSPWNKIVMKR